MRRIAAFFLTGLVMMACNLTQKSDSTSVPAISIQQVTATPAPTPLPVQDANFIFDGVCYAGLRALAGQQWMIGDDAALMSLYDTMVSQCDDEIARPGFDFSSQILVVVVDAVQACHAEFIALGLENNHLMLQFRKSGTCSYNVIAVYAGTLARPAGQLQVTVNRAQAATTLPRSTTGIFPAGTPRNGGIRKAFTARLSGDCCGSADSRTAGGAAGCAVNRDIRLCHY